jgi:hypothetical protein
LGIEPSPSLRALHRRVLEQDPALEPDGGTRNQRLSILFTQCEEPPGRWDTDAQAMAAIVERHDQIVGEAVEAVGGRVMAATNGAIDAVFAEWVDRPELADAFFDGYGRRLSDDETALLTYRGALQAMGTVIWAREHGDPGFEQHGWRVLDRVRRTLSP